MNNIKLFTEGGDIDESQAVWLKAKMEEPASIHPYLHDALQLHNDLLLDSDKFKKSRIRYNACKSGSKVKGRILKDLC